MLKTLQKIAKGIESNLILLILLSIIAGIAFGWLLPAQAKGLKAYTTVALFVMLYPMMIGLRIEEVGKAAANLKLISLSMLFNFVFSPLLAAGLAFLFLRDRPDFAVGLILTGTAPCAGMVAGWTGYAKGNVALALVIGALSLLVSIVMIPIWMPILAGVYVQIDALAMFKDILIAVVVPLYENMIAFSYGVAGKNISIALALATIFFSPMTVLVLALKPVIQIAFMTAFLRISPWLKTKLFLPPVHAQQHTIGGA